MEDGAVGRLLERKAAALVARDAAALAAVIHDDFLYVNAAGRHYDKPAHFEAFRTTGRCPPSAGPASAGNGRPGRRR